MPGEVVYGVFRAQVRVEVLGVKGAAEAAAQAGRAQTARGWTVQIEVVVQVEVVVEVEGVVLAGVEVQSRVVRLRMLWGQGAPPVLLAVGGGVAGTGAARDVVLDGPVLRGVGPGGVVAAGPAGGASTYVKAVTV